MTKKGSKAAVATQGKPLQNKTGKETTVQKGKALGDA